MSGRPPAALYFWNAPKAEKTGPDDQELPASPRNPSYRTNQLTEATEETETRWDGKLKKFVPLRRPDVRKTANMPRAVTPFLLKEKILRALGDYRVVHGDLMHIYIISHQEARHAIGQLERLLWGQPRHEAANRLDRYHLWKKDYSQSLQTMDSTFLFSGEDDDSSMWTSMREQDAATLHAAWQRLDTERRERLWPQMILSALNGKPGVLPSFVRATFDSSWCPSYVIEDMFYALFRATNVLSDGKRIEKETCKVAVKLLESCPPRYIGLEQTALLKIASPMSNDELVDFYQDLKRTEHPLHANTLLHFASHFAASAEHKLHAADIIYSLTEIPGFDINSPAAASVCTSLLTLNENGPLPEGHAAPDELFKLLLERGLRPNLLGLSALMRNFCVRGHIDTAWTIFELLLQHGIEPDTHVYSILFNGATQNMDIASARRILRVIGERGAWSPVIVNDCLEIIRRDNEAQQERRRRQRKKSSNAWRPMLQLYAKFYDLAPLQKLTLFPLENVLVSSSAPQKHTTPVSEMMASLPPQPESMLMQPDSITLSTMLGAHMRTIHGPSNLRRYYAHFKHLVSAEDLTAVGLLEKHQTLVYDIFLRAFLQYKISLDFALDIVRTMLFRAKREKQQLGYNRLYHSPSVHTWTILLNGFKNHWQTEGAIHVLNLMSKTGDVQPNIVTWNALITSFALERDVRGAVKAMRYLEEAGIQSNDRTVRAFSIFPRGLREKAIKMLEELRKHPVDLARPGAFFEEDRMFAKLKKRDFLVKPSRSRPANLGLGLDGVARAQREWGRVAQDRER
ncbi:Uu.00g099570.m01.CDS01 [Anthostomella pinea]|uniref:Uu.00g099570.m01.CDS01 n=1 Tax=Anthostomella pinea TaxID=933095 RepID=A0AAI8YFD2_9PEZI|nr:Uu.00g099570.m01.CDS01 [Anthostomella pinea]